MISAQELYALIEANPVSCPSDGWVERVNGELMIVPDYARWPDGTAVETIGRLGVLARDLFDDATCSRLGF